MCGASGATKCSQKPITSSPASTGPVVNQVKPMPLLEVWPGIFCLWRGALFFSLFSLCAILVLCAQVLYANLGLSNQQQLDVSRMNPSILPRNNQFVELLNHVTSLDHIVNFSWNKQSGEQLNVVTSWNISGTCRLWVVTTTDRM